MQSNLYIPKKIKVGFQKRTDTFTGKLGFVTYLDDKGILRQENSWNGWRDKKLEPIDFDNEPRSNLVLTLFLIKTLIAVGIGAILQKLEFMIIVTLNLKLMYQI